MSRVVVAGGAGFLGSHLCEALAARGQDVVAVDNEVTGWVANLSALAGRPGFTYLRQDVCDPVSLDGPIDAVMHLASPASPADFASMPVEILRAGSAGTHQLLELARANHARFFLASTSEVYGDPLVHPQTEAYWGNVNPVGPRSAYDEAKRFAEAMTRAYHRRYGVDVAIVRIFNTYGPRMRVDDGRVVTNFLVQALEGRPLTVYGDGQQTRSFCYVDDEVRGFLSLLDSGETGPINIGNPDEHTMLDLAKLVLEVTGSKSGIEFQPRPLDDPAQRRPDITLARERLGWTPIVGIREGLAATAASLRERLHG